MATAPRFCTDPSRRRGLFLRLFAILLMASCTDGPPVNPVDVTAGGGSLRIGAQFSFAGVENQAQGNALAAAFDEVNRFRLILTRIPGGEVALDTIIQVTPGQESYDLQVDVTLLQQEESFTVQLTALKDDTVLFEAEPFTVQASSSATSGEPAPSQVSVVLSYAGPGVTAVSISLDPGALVLAPGGTRELAAEVLDGSGVAITDVPLAWSSDAPGVASIAASGLVTGAGEGAAQVTVTTPTGLVASAWIYVIAGEIAFVRDGHVLVSPAGGGDPVDMTPEASAAASPAWDPAGVRLFYEDVEGVTEVGVGAPLVSGSLPSVSPDGQKLVMAGGGGVLFSNDDGTNPTPGPAGATPQWTPDGKHVVVAGGSIERVKADGSDRSVLAGMSDAFLPSVNPATGQIAFLAGADGGGTRVMAMGPNGEVLREVMGSDAGASGRPTWSANGDWILVAGSGGFVLASSAGGAPSIVVEGLGDGSDPAWRPNGSLETPPPLTLTSLNPENPRPSQEVEILGKGFDWIIKRNNLVLFPGPTGPVVGEVLEAYDTRLVVRVPSQVVEGTLSVTTRSGEGALPFTPAPGALEVFVFKSPSKAMAGVTVILWLDGAEVTRGVTGTGGLVVFEGLAAGEYEVEALPPEGFDVVGDGTQGATVENGGSGRVEVELTPRVHSIRVAPDPLAVAVGGEVAMEATLLDIQGDPLPLGGRTVTWTGFGGIGVTGAGLTGTLRGTYPSPPGEFHSLQVGTDDVLKPFPVTVTSAISGIVSGDLGVPLSDFGVDLFQGGVKVLATSTDEAGAYEFSGLAAGTYTVVPVLVSPKVAAPPTQVITLGKDTPVGTADFTISDGGPTQTYEGSLTIDEPADLVTFAAERYGRITGNLTIRQGEGPNLTNLTGMETLSVVEGELDIRDNPFLVDINGLQGLQEVQKGVYIWNNSVLQNLNGFGFATLTTVGENLEIDSNPALTSVSGLSGLQSVGMASSCSYPNVETVSGGGCGDFAITNNDALPAISGLSSLTQIGGGLIVTDNQILAHMSGFSNLRSIDGQLGIVDNPALASVAGLVGVSGPIYMLRIVNNPGLVSLNGLQGISTVQSHAWVSWNTALSNFDGLAGISFIGGHFWVQQNHTLQNMQGMSALATVGSTLILQNNPALNSMNNLPSLTVVGGRLRMFHNPGTVVGLPALQDVGGFLMVWHLDPDPYEIEDLMWDEPEQFAALGPPVLQVVSLPSLQCVGRFILFKNNPVLQTIDMSGMPESPRPCGYPDEDDDWDGPPDASFMLFQDNPALTTLNLTSIQTLRGKFVLKDNDALTTLNLGAVRTIWHQLRLEANDALASVDLGSLQTVFYDDVDEGEETGFVHINQNPNLSALNLGSVSTLGGFIAIEGTALTTLPNLGSLPPDAVVFIRGNPNLTNLDGLAGTSRLHGLDISYNRSLNDLSALSSLTAIDTDLDIVGNESLTTLSGLDNLTTIGGKLEISDNPNLATLTGTVPATAPREFTGGIGGGDGLWTAPQAAGGLANVTALGGGTELDEGDTYFLRGDLRIQNNPSLQDVGLLSLGSIGTVAKPGRIYIEGNNSLPNLSGLGGVGGTLYLVYIRYNRILASVTGLDNAVWSATATRYFTVEGNEALGDAAAYALRDQMATNSGGLYPNSTVIQNNGPLGISPPLFLDAQAGEYHSCGLGASGEMYCWGEGSSGQLGNGSSLDRSVAYAVSGGSSWRTIVPGSIVVGSKHSCGLDSSGNAHCWGWNAGGQLGNGSVTNRFVPTPVSGSHTFVSLTAGFNHTCGIMDTGQALCWGSNTYGQLGDGSTSSVPTPTPVAGGHTFTQISAGYSHTCGVRTDGLGLCWGHGTDGELGNGVASHATVPTTVAGGHVFAEIHAGWYFSVGFTTSGAGWGWGWNEYGNLGTGNKHDDDQDHGPLTPQPMAGGITFNSMSAGWYHACGKNAAGNGFCWGYNGYGQVGDASDVDKLTPSAISGGQLWSVISAGRNHSCGVSGGVPWCWGQGSPGRLGDGSLLDSLIPVRVRVPLPPLTVRRR